MDQRPLITDQSRFNDLFREHYAPLVNRVYRVVREQSKSEDIVQDLFIDLWKKKDTIINVESVGAYLNKAALFKTYDFLRKEKTKQHASSEEYNIDTPSPTASPEEQMISSEKIETIKQAIDQLPDKGRTIFYMSRQNGLSYREIAETLKISQKTVEYHMIQNLKFLRKAIYFGLLMSFLQLF